MYLRQALRNASGRNCGGPIAVRMARNRRAGGRLGSAALSKVAIGALDRVDAGLDAVSDDRELNATCVDLGLTYAKIAVATGLPTVGGQAGGGRRWSAWEVMSGRRLAAD